MTYENGQARERTQILMDLANQSGGMVIGTGDLSELALGWATYNGDHMSMYAVNASVPKTLVRHLVLPGHRKESIALLHQLAELLPADAFLLSLMGQYTPPEQHLEDPFLNRRIATFEYESVRKCAVQLGLNGYGQDRSSATASYTPDFWID